MRNTNFKVIISYPYNDNVVEEVLKKIKKKLEDRDMDFINPQITVLAETDNIKTFYKHLEESKFILVILSGTASYINKVKEGECKLIEELKTIKKYKNYENKTIVFLYVGEEGFKDLIIREVGKAVEDEELLSSCRVYNINQKECIENLIRHIIHKKEEDRDKSKDSKLVTILEKQKEIDLSEIYEVKRKNFIVKLLSSCEIIKLETNFKGNFMYLKFSSEYTEREVRRVVNILGLNENEIAMLLMREILDSPFDFELEIDIKKELLGGLVTQLEDLVKQFR